MDHRLEARKATSLALLGSLLALGACNSLTGADDVRIDPDWEDDAGGSTGTEAGGGPTAGVGGTTGTGPSGSGSTGSGPGSTGSGPSTGSGSSGAGGDPGPTQCEYPAGPYGVGMNQTVPPTLTWQGFAPGAATASTIRMSDFHDCDGTRGIHALYFDTSQFG